MNAQELNQKFASYETTLKELQEKCKQAETQAIVAETNLKNLEDKKAKLIEEIEQYTGVSVDQAKEMLEQKSKDLAVIMERLNQIDYKTAVVSDDDVKAVQAIIKDFGIPTPAEEVTA